MQVAGGRFSSSSYRYELLPSLDQERAVSIRLEVAKIQVHVSAINAATAEWTNRDKPYMRSSTIVTCREEEVLGDLIFDGKHHSWLAFG